MFWIISFLLYVSISTHQGAGQETQTCVVPRHPKNGIYVYSDASLKPGNQVDVISLSATCNPGYKVVGENQINCFFGTWSSTKPLCIADPGKNQNSEEENPQCIVPKPPKNGVYMSNNRILSPGSRVDVISLNITCDPGYKTAGDGQINCFFGTWSNNLPTCTPLPEPEYPIDELEKSCQMPDHPQNGLYISNNQVLKAGSATSIISFNITCNKGYLVKGDLTVNCFFGQWSNSILPICEPSQELQAAEENAKYVCVVPDPPENGYYISSKPDLQPGSRTDSISLNVLCQPGYRLIGDENLLCYEGDWLNNRTPVCRSACKVEPSIGVEYRCLISNPKNFKITRDCEDLELEGTIMRPKCVYPSYYSERELSTMHCVGGFWNSTPVCLSECGILTPQGKPLIVGGEEIKRGDVPWHAGIYRRTESNPEQVCGGSIINKKVILSAAHCFWHEYYKQLPAINYAVAVGQLYREWNNSQDRPYAQLSNVNDIILPKRFFGAQLNYQHDLAIVIVQTAFEYHPYIRPVCIDFRKNFNDNQLKSNNLGKVAGWGLTTGFKGSMSPVLKGLDLPFVPYEECINRTPPTFVEFIVGDKFCAGYANGTGPCEGDSGGGLTFAAKDSGILRHYIRGIVSTSPPTLDSKQCNLNALTSFTEVIQHSTFIGKYLDKFYCADGETIPASMCCDGAVDCQDGSDETNATCSGRPCPSFLFRCAYGACADQKSTCNGINECADGSDETEELCGRNNKKENFNNGFPQGGKCKLPPYPERGTYTVINAPNTMPGDSLSFAILNITCTAGYGVEDHVNRLICLDGEWERPVPKCVRLCKLNKHPSIIYQCPITWPRQQNGFRECLPSEPVGTIVKYECTQNHYRQDEFVPMECFEEGWNFVAICNPECGRVTNDILAPGLDGRFIVRGELPWHATIFDKSRTPYKQICGGSIVRTSMIITAAHCFLDNNKKMLPATNFYVTVGNLYRSPDHDEDFTYRQESDVKKIVVSQGFKKFNDGFVNDIAAVMLTKPFYYTSTVRNVCVDFKGKLNTGRGAAFSDLGKYGKVASWGNMQESADPTKTLKVRDIQILPLGQECQNCPRDCLSYIPSTYRDNMKDKVCVGYIRRAHVVCRWDGGSGYAVPEPSLNTIRYYLRGVASVIPQFEPNCAVQGIAIFTNLTKHLEFIKQFENVT